LNVTNFLKDHPGGKKAILLFAGKDASDEFNMLVSVFDLDFPLSLAQTGCCGEVCT
jgi:cytochrome b involved in lipid metabolism